jgi:acyl-CoA thioester hydrolase
MAPATSQYRVQVRFCETDLMGVVHHANYLLYCEAARVDWLRRRGVRYDAWVKHGIHLPVVEARLRFKAAARFDEELVVETTRTDLSRITVRFRYRITRGDTLLCDAETLLACVGDDMKLRRMPPDVAAVFELGETAGA